MGERELKRRLAAVVAADVAGYSRLIGRNEEATVLALNAHRAELIGPKVREYGGRIANTAGDSLLIEFPSVVEALRCALDVQSGMARRNSQVAADARIEFRIGINVGDVIEQNGDLLGDCVNIAARLEGLAEPGGITVSGAVHDHVGDKLDIAYRDLGEQTVKNIAEPVRLYRVLLSDASSAPDLSGAERRYRASVKDRYAEDAAFYVPLSGTAAELAAPALKAPRSARRFARRARIDYREWVALDGDIRQVGIDDLRTAVEKYAAIVLLGDPGCGKTTAIEALAFGYADRPDRLPVLLRLSEFAIGDTVEDFIGRGWGGARDAGHWQAPDLAASLRAFLEAGRLLLLFDALNEMPHEGYRERCAALRAFIDTWSAKGNRAVVTCRRLDYGEEMSGLQRVEIQALGDDQVRRFLENELPGRWQNLWRTLLQDRGEHRLLELARNPYLLTVMIDVFEEDEVLSRNRAELMRRFTEIMLEWAKAKCPADRWLDAKLQFEALSVMAYEMQARSGFGTRVTTDQIKAVMPHRLQPDPRWPAEATPPDQILSLAAEANIIEMPVDRLTVRFYHQLLQEYFAARWMVRQDVDELAARWRCPILEAEMPPWSRPENNYEPMPPPPPTGWEETTILAAAMAPADDHRFWHALLQVNPVLAGRCLQPGAGEGGMRQAVIAGLLAAIQNPDVALRVRIAAAGALGHLGDPRLGDMVTIPGGPFLMGEDREQHEVALPDYEIGKYSVTNVEYARFIDAGGYRDRTWWTDAGWTEVGPKRSEPHFWLDGRFNQPNQPVMGLSWYECVAYCRWLSAETGRTWRLPTEAEWEKAARGTDGFVFPWGNGFDPTRLNGRGPRDRQVCTSTPVGSYPTGASPFGLFDCVGNVWEWCSTRWKKPYPYDTRQDEWQADYLQGRNLRVLRGGSWYDTSEATRCTNRFRFQPYGWNDRGGFRLASTAHRAGEGS
jgi:formylglycine-generating enzyme required for sulfatase activity/class 3 adenylate cyclase